ncbi:MAG TPA: HD domain-containing protein [Cytophagales bacterium]
MIEKMFPPSAPPTERMETALATITAFADRAHGQQTRRYTPERYIVHPVRVMELCREYTADEAVLAAALLHDVLEDTPVTRKQMTEFLLTVMAPEAAYRTVRLVEELTDVYVKDAYPHLNRQQRKKREADRLAGTSPDAQTIKYADIIDNGTEMIRHDPAFARLFLREGKAALLKMTAGDSRLYQRALRTIDECLNAV